MNIRRDPIYISTDVWKWLRLLAKADRSRSADAPVESIVTADEIADDILRQAIREQHPQLPEFQKHIEKLEREIVKTLGEK